MREYVSASEIQPGDLIELYGCRNYGETSEFQVSSVRYDDARGMYRFIGDADEPPVEVFDFQEITRVG